MVTQNFSDPCTIELASSHPKTYSYQVPSSFHPYLLRYVLLKADWSIPVSMVTQNFSDPKNIELASTHPNTYSYEVR